MVDANVLSEATKSAPNGQCIAWLKRHERELVVDPMIIGEILHGILLMPEGHRRQKMEQWFDSGVQLLRCLPWDAETGVRWAALVARLERTGRPMPVKDSIIAATALVHGLTLATRNRSDFERTGVRIVDPFQAVE